MIDFYPQIKWVHVVAVLISGSVFLLRAVLLNLGHVQAARAGWLRWCSWVVDSVLLTAALMLFTILPRELFANGWLWVKLLLLPCYVAAGHHALRRAATPPARRLWCLLALGLYVWMITVARAHHRLGWLAGLRT